MLTLLDWTAYSRKMETDAQTKMGPEYAEGPAREGHDLPFWQRRNTGNQGSGDTPVGISGVNEVLRVYVVPGGAPLLLSKEFLRDFGCHIDLGRGHLFFEKLGVRAVVTSEHSPHLPLPLTSFGPEGHKIPAEIQPRISSDECAIYRAACDSSRQNKIHSWIASASDHRAPETDSTNTECLYETDGREKNSCDEARDSWENKGTMGESTWCRQADTVRPNAR